MAWYFYSTNVFSSPKRLTKDSLVPSIINTKTLHNNMDVFHLPNTRFAVTYGWIIFEGKGSKRNYNLHKIQNSQDMTTKLLFARKINSKGHAQSGSGVMPLTAGSGKGALPCALAYHYPLNS